ncbi:MAG: BRCT domain-containing protein [Flavobacteriaceae bacterium]|nr:BRCT domain-containing protein [Flavobacteriaceae bacterium]
MNYLLLIIFSVISFISILYLFIFFYPRKNGNSFKKNKYKEKIEFNHTKNIDDIFRFQKKDLIYNQHFFSGKKVLITGDLKYFRNRNDLAKLLWDNGAITEKAYNSSIDILIVGKSNIDSLKLKSAFYLNIKVITEEELLNYFPDFKPFSEKTISEL